MCSRKRLFCSVGIPAISILAVIGIALFILYQSAFDIQCSRLAEIVKSQACLIEAVTQSDSKYSATDVDGEAFTATLWHLHDAHRQFTLLGKTTEITLAKCEVDQIVFFLKRTHHDQSKPQIVPLSSPLAEPMRLALAGKSGTIVGLDYHGETVLAAYEPIRALGLGIVAKIDLAEIRAPFIRAGLLAAGFGVIFILLYILVFFKLSNSLLLRLEENEQKYHTLFSSSTYGVIALGEVIEDCNDQFCRIFACRPDDVIGSSLADFLMMTDSDMPNLEIVVRGKINAALAGTPQSFQWLGIRKDGTIIDLDITIKSTEYGGRKICLGTIHDITESNRTAMALRQEQERAQEYLDIAGVIMIALDADGRITMINQKGCEVLEATKDELIGKLWFDNFLPASMRDEVKKVFTLLMAGELEGVNYYENLIVTAQGQEKIISWHNIILHDDTGKPIGTLSSGEDITQQKHAQAQLLRYQDELRALASELSAIEERERHRFATDLHDTIGHDLVSAKMKLAMLPTDELSAESSGVINEIGTLIGEAMRRIQTMTFELSPPVLHRFGLTPAIEHLADRFRNQHGLLIRVDDDQQQKSLNAQVRIALFRGVRELLINVVKHAHAQQARVTLRRKSDDIQIEVEDRGRGFDLQQMDNRGRGGGFGLFSLSERLRYLGGALDITSNPGTGTKVVLTAPLNETAS